MTKIITFILLGFHLVFATSVGLKAATKASIESGSHIKKQAIEKKDVFIGVQMDMSGDKVQEGGDTEKAFYTLVETYSKKQRFSDKNIKLIFCNDKGTPSGSLICADKFLKKEVFFVIGSNKILPTLASAPIYKSNNILQLISLSSNDLLDLNKDNISLFRTTFSDNSESSYIASYISKEGYDKIAIIGDDSGYSQEKSVNIYESIKDMGGNIVLNMSLNKDLSNMDIILKYIKSKADIIVYTGTHKGALTLTSRLSKETKSIKFIGTHRLDTRLFYSKLEKAIRTRILIPNLRGIHAFKSPKMLEFMQDYKNKYDTYPHYISTFENVDTLEILLHAISISGTLNFRVVSKVLTSITDFEGVLGFISMQENGDRFNIGFEMYTLDLEGNMIGYDNAYNDIIMGD